MEYTVKTDIWRDGDIEQSVIRQDRITGMREIIMRDIMRTKEEGVRNALIKLGWTPPPD